MGRRERESKRKRKGRKEKKRDQKSKHELKRVGEWAAGWLAPMVDVAGRTLVFLEPPDGVTGLFHEVAGDPPLDVAEEFRVACADPISLPPRRPQRVRTADEGLAAQLREVPKLTVALGPTPEIREFEEKLRTEFARTGRASSMGIPSDAEGALDDDSFEDEDAQEDEGAPSDEALDDELLLPAGLPEEVVRRFYSAAAALDNRELWECVRDGRFLDVSIGGLEELGPRFVLPLHGDGEPQSVLVFDSKKEADAYDRDFWGEVDAPMAHLSMIYEPVSELSAAGRVKLSAWAQTSDAFLVLRHLDEEPKPASPPNEAEVRLATAILVGLRVLFRAHGEALASARSESVTLRVETAELPDHPAVTFTLSPWDGAPAPYADLAIEEDTEGLENGDYYAPSDPELETALTRLATAGRNEPCPCGSRKKYKKCHFVEDQNRRYSPPEAPGGQKRVGT